MNSPANTTQTRRMPRNIWKPGQSGNPNGRPKKDRDLAEAAREHTAEAIAALVKALANPRTCVAAASELLDRGWGRAPQQIDLGGEITINGGIDAPPRSESWEEWNARRRADLAAVEPAAGTPSLRH
jgi:uncharacterized protein DUF5681